ncbi:MAG: hypothetical protein AAF617_03900 [Bacteroidota bacterium]
MKNSKECTKPRRIKGIYSCDNYADVYVGSCHEIEQKIAQNSDLESVRFEADVHCNQYLYFVCWSDDMGLNGLLAELTGNQRVVSGGSKKWEVFPTGIDFDRANSRPSLTVVNEQVNKAHCDKWKAVSVGEENRGNTFRSYPNIGSDARFVWYDSGRHQHSQSPFRGFNHDEFLIFRFPINALFEDACKECAQECNCVDECGCGPCTDAIQTERAVLKEQALGKTFTVTGNENNPKVCKTPYANTTCSSLELPKLEPCFYLHWGDHSKDQLVTNNSEVLYITACNPYQNLRMRGITITKISIVYRKEVAREKVSQSKAAISSKRSAISQPVKATNIRMNEPSKLVGTVKPTKEEFAGNAIQIVPNRLIHLGDLCGCSCASQAVHLSMVRARAAEYEILVEYCIDQIEINQDNTGKTRFPITVING